MSINGSSASFLPFTINGLTDASFSNSNLGVATATALTLTSATPLKLARFDLDKNLVSASVDESEVAVLTSNVFNGTQTMKPGFTTNINNVIETNIIANPPYDKSSFTTSGISGYTAPLGTLSGPTAGEFSISQSVSDRSIMKLNGFIPQVGRKYVYTFTMRIIDAPEAYVSVEQGGVQRSNTIIQIGVDDTTISDTFTFDPSGSTLIFKIYTGSLDPWTATWSSFSLGYYEASINAPINNLTVNNLATELLAFPSTITNSESWSVYAISTMGNPSTLGGLVFQEASLGVGAYITGGVVGAKSFQFNTLSGNAGKVVVTNADQVMSTSINAGQLEYITGLTSQAGGVGQANTWTGVNDFTTLTSVGALRITSSIANNDYSLSVNSFDQLEIRNITTGNTMTTSGDALSILNINAGGTITTGNIEIAGNSQLIGSGTVVWTQTALSDDYEIKDDVGDMRLRLSKTTGLTISTINITAIPSAAPSLALGVNGSGGVVSFAVPTAANILPLNNTFTGTNTFNNTVSTLATTTVSSKAYLTQSLRTAGMSSQAVQPGVITGGAPWLLTPSPASSPLASCYSPTQIWITGARYIFRFANFSYGVFGMSLTFYQANVGDTGAIPISATFPFVVGDFTGILTPNINSSFLGQVYLQFQGTANKTFNWTSFTYEVGTLEIVGELEMNGIANINGGTNFAVANNYMSPGSLTIGDPARNYGGGVAGWTTNTAGLLLECLDRTEIAVHDAGARVASMSFYDGSTNTFILGRDMGFGSGVSNVATGGTLTTGGSLTVPATATIQKTGGNSGANSFRVTGSDAGTSPYAEFFFNNLRRMYVGNVSATDATIVGENGAQLNFLTQGISRMTIDTGGGVNVVNVFRKNNNVNPTTTFIALQDGNSANTPYIDWTLNGTRKAYLGYATASNFDFAVENSASLSLNTNGVNRILIAAAGLTTITTGLTTTGTVATNINTNGGLIVNGSGGSAGITVNGAAGINCVNGGISSGGQPFCIVGAVGGASIGYSGGGVNFGSSGYLFAYTSAAMSNVSGNGWDSSFGAFWAPRTGKWQVNWSFYWNNFVAGSRAIINHYNNFGTLLESRYCALNGAGIVSDTTQAYSSVFSMASGSYLTCNFQSGSGTLYFGGITHTHLTFYFLS